MFFKCYSIVYVLAPENLKTVGDYLNLKQNYNSFIHQINFYT